jgi:flavorubredoxin
MRVVIIFHSFSGTTRRVAERLAERIGGTVETDVVEVHDRHQYSTLTAYVSGAPRAMRGERAEVDPPEIDVSRYDLIVLGTPVWAFSPTPAANGAVSALRSAGGKEAVILVTSGGSPRNTVERLTAQLEGQGMTVRGAVHFTRKEIDDEERFAVLVDIVTRRPSDD